MTNELKLSDDDIEEATNFKTFDEANTELERIFKDYEGLTWFDKNRIKIVKETREIVK